MLGCFRGCLPACLPACLLPLPEGTQNRHSNCALQPQKKGRKEKSTQNCFKTRTVASVFFSAKFRQNAKNKIETRIFWSQLSHFFLKRNRQFSKKTKNFSRHFIRL
jgi:hypothetical protein